MLDKLRKLLTLILYVVIKQLKLVVTILKKASNVVLNKVQLVIPEQVSLQTYANTQH